MYRVIPKGVHSVDIAVVKFIARRKQGVGEQLQLVDPPSES